MGRKEGGETNLWYKRSQSIEFAFSLYTFWGVSGSRIDPMRGKRRTRGLREGRTREDDAKRGLSQHAFASFATVSRVH